MSLTQSSTCKGMISALVDRYRCPEEFLRFGLVGRLSADAGYFGFGPSAICYGRTSTGYRTQDPDALLYAALPDRNAKSSEVLLPFNPTEVIDNLRLERYTQHCLPSEWSWRLRFLRDTYYRLRPFMGVSVRRHLQRLRARGWSKMHFPRWPVDTSVEQLSEILLIAAMNAKRVDRIPFIWFWPQGAKGCVIMTHDVEGPEGHNFCSELMDIDDAHNLKASFQLVPEKRYQISGSLIDEIRARGFEVCIQDLNHDGYLFADRQEFLRRVQKINDYARLYGATGFRSAILYRNLNWYDELDFSYDMSVPNVAPMDPQRGGCCTVMPYFVGRLLEIPVTTTQDYTLFHLLGDYSLDLWKTQAESIRKNHGLLSFLTHPDYLIDKKARNVYCELLSWLHGFAEEENMWRALPGEVDQWWRSRSEMRLVNERGQWKIEGPGSDRAVLAFAKVNGDHIEYEIDPKTHDACDHDSRVTGTNS